MQITERQVRKATKKAVKAAGTTKKRVVKETRSALRSAAVVATKVGVSAGIAATKAGLALRKAGKEASDQLSGRSAKRKKNVRNAGLALAALGTAAAVTVAVRLLPVSREISPKKSPSPMSRTFR